MTFWDFFWLLIWSYVIVAYLVVLFQIFADIFRDHDLGGFGKALWVLGLIIVPILGSLIYLIARGKGMAERRADMYAERQAQYQAQYGATMPSAPAPSPVDQITSAKALRDSGSITEGEFESLKAKALAAA